jgi:predicted Zn-dependent protease
LQGKEKEAKNEFAKIKKSKPENLVDYIDLSEIYLNQKGLEFAIKFLDEAIKKRKFTNQLYAQKLKIKFMAGEKITESDI